MTNKPVALPLHNKELEYQVLSNLMNYVNLYSQYRELLSERLFDSPACRAVFHAIKEVFDSGDIPDLLTVSMWLNANPIPNAPDMAEVAEIYGFAATSVNFESEVMMLADMEKRRRYYVLGHKMIKAGTDATFDIDQLDKDMDDMREQNLQAANDIYTMVDINDALGNRIQQNVKDDRSNMVPTGYYYIDDKGGFQLTDFIVIGGATSQGKTTLAINILVNAAQRCVPGMFFSLEMTIEQLAARINAPLSGVASSLMLYKKLHDSQIRKFNSARAVSDGLPIYIDDSSTTYEKIKEKIRSMAIKRSVKVFFIDYIQILSTTKRGRESESQFFETVSRDFKNLAKELKVCIVALSQLNREVKDADPRPTISKLKASSGIEQAADTVILVYRPGYYGKRHKYRPDLDPNTTSELIIDKGRNIGTGSCYVGFKAELSQFYDLNVEEPAPAAPAAEQQKLPF